MYDIKTLEFDKVLSKLKNYITNNYAKEQLDNLEINNDYETIIRMKDEVKEAFDAIVKMGNPSFLDVSIVDSIKRARLGSTLSINEFLDIVALINNVLELKRYAKSLDTIKLEMPNLNEYFKSLDVPKNLKNQITLAISEDGTILDNASRELFVIRRSLKSLEIRLRSKLNELLSTRSKELTESLIVMRDNRLCLPVKVEFKNSFKGIIHDISSSNTTCYIEPQETIEIANQIDNYKEHEKKEIENILKGLTLLVEAESDLLLNSFNLIVKLDTIFAKAKMGREMDYNIVNIDNKQSFDIKNAKHPLIDKEKCVPIDITLSQSNSAIVITGPNTGGKTVTLKTVGLIHLMAYFGMMLPISAKSTLGYFTDIVADIGDEQSIEQSLSTFSSHMKKVAKICDNLNSKTLVLLDEVGSGTDPKEGSSLAIAIIDYIKNRGKIIATTHYSELKTYAYQNEGIVNASVEFNTETLMPTYRILMGVPGKSNALDISKRLGLQDEILTKAKAEMDNNKTESVELLGNLEEEMNKLKQQKDELEKEINRYNYLNKSLSEQKIEISKSTDKIIKKAKQDAEDILNEAKKESEALIKEIKNMSEENFKEHELAELTRKARNLNVKAEDNITFDDKLEIGDYVFVKPYEKYGDIIKIKGNKYTVKFGMFELEFKRNDLEKAVRPVTKPQKPKKITGYNPASHASLSLDLRGKRYEEVKPLLDSYIDQALLGNLSEVSIIHGFGTGTIRKAVQEYLKTCPYVKNYRYGGEGEGLNGVTVVYLK